MNFNLQDAILPMVDQDDEWRLAKRNLASSLFKSCSVTGRPTSPKRPSGFGLVASSTDLKLASGFATSPTSPISGPSLVIPSLAPEERECLFSRLPTSLATERASKAVPD